MVNVTATRSLIAGQRFLRIFLPFCLACLFLPSLYAQSYEEGRAAYIAGDYDEAFNILEPLAEDGNSEAQKMLGIMYDYGHGVTANSEKALYWYLLSAEQGHPAVQYQVGAKYFRGDGVKQNYQEAAKWWEQAANGGQVDAQFNLGLMYFRGLSIEPDDERAAFLFSQAAEQGHGHAQYSLAVMYAFGRGVDKDYAQALQWFQKSADQGIGQAQFNLGVFYENGYGVEKDIDEALKWYGLAAVQDVKEADQKLIDLRSAKNDDIAEPEEQPAAEEVVGSPEIVIPEDVTDEEEIVVDLFEEEPATPVSSSTESTDSGIKGESWVMQQTPEYYTLQIGSVTREDDIVNFLRENGIESEAAYVQVVIKEVTRYNALYGVYENYSAANEAVESLPAALRKVKPWVRSFKMIQKLLADSES